jgi:hypothetical protein
MTIISLVSATPESEFKRIQNEITTLTTTREDFDPEVDDVEFDINYAKEISMQIIEESAAKYVYKIFKTVSSEKVGRKIDNQELYKKMLLTLIETGGKVTKVKRELNLPLTVGRIEQIFKRFLRSKASRCIGDMYNVSSYYYFLLQIKE